MSSPSHIKFNENDDDLSIFSHDTVNFDQEEYLSIQDQIQVVEEEIRQLEEMAEFYRIIRNVTVYEPSGFLDDM